MFSRLKFNVDFISEVKIHNLEHENFPNWLVQRKYAEIGLKMTKIDCQKKYFEKSLYAIMPQI